MKPRAPLDERSRLPIDHPDYLYPESKNPYWTKIQDYAGLILSDNGTETHAGRWREHFPDAMASGASKSGHGRRRPLHVEIGCNAGHVILEWAARDPRSAYVGIDWKFKPIFRGAEKAVDRKIANLLFFRAHAERLPFMFGAGEIDRLALYFPDPWPRKKQWKNRFISVERLRQIAPSLHPDGEFHIKTDHPGYFEWMEAAVAELPDLWTVTERTTDLHHGHPAPRELQIPEVTLFERLFIKDGIKIHSMKLKRTAPKPNG